MDNTKIQANILAYNMNAALCIPLSPSQISPVASDNFSVKYSNGLAQDSHLLPFMLSHLHLNKFYTNRTIIARKLFNQTKIDSTKNIFTFFSPATIMNLFKQTIRTILQEVIP